MVRKTNFQFIILFSFVIFSLVASPAFLSSAYNEGYRTSGDISFIDSSGNLLNGKMEISGGGRSSGTNPDVNSISWDKVPDAKIRFNALDTKDVSVYFIISGDSPKGKVIMENYGSSIPGGVNLSAPGVPVKYVEITASGVFFSEAGISIRYSNKELKGHDENGLAVYGFNSASKTWNKLPASIDAGNNILSTTVDSLSIFALSAPAQEKKAVHDTNNKIVVHDAKNIPVTGDIKTYDRNRALKKETKTSTLSSADIPENGELEIDALKSKNVSLKLKLRSQSGGEIILDDHGKKNPVTQAPPGTAVKYVDISAQNLDFDSAEVRIHYSDAELGNAKENELFIYHWNGASWEPLRITVDPANNMITAATTSLSPFAVSGGTGGTGRILVAANRFVILDDPRTTGARSGMGFTLPVYDYSTWNFWANKTTTINATALYIDENGAPVNDTVIRFTLYDPDGTVNSTSDVVTNSAGLANFSYDMNQMNFYGRWNIRAENGSIGQNTTFTYNWWGCSYSASPCNQNHGSSRTPTASGSASANSPYATGRDTTVNQISNHYGGSTNCTFCHQSYDGNTGGAWANWGNQTSFSSADTHRNIRCDNSNCHSGLSVHRTNEVIASCYNTTGGCHTSRADISNKSTLDSSTVSTALSLYSINSSAFNATFHTPNSTIPCIICHGPMHNISKPDITLKLTNNSFTEDSNCRNCHSSYVEHNSSNATSGGVNCTLCHSDDVHAIQVFAKSGTYVTLNKSGPNADRGDCTSCHQNSTLFDTIKSNQKAGQQTGRNPPIIPNPLHHADVLTNGTRYGGYWTYDSADLSCKYCHGYVNHKSTALGRPSLFMGSNQINATFAGGTTSWCLLCHYPDSANYSDMVTTFEGDNLSVPPSIIKGSQYYISGRNHSYAVYNDSLCYTCHNDTLPVTGISQFMHGTLVGGGGPDCLSCHDMGKNGSVLHVNNTVMKLSMHANVNNNSANSSGVSADNKKCWGCHQSDGSEPGNTSMGDKYDKPYTCYECHLKGTKPYENVANAGSIVNHIDEDSPLTRIVTHNATCTTCHNNSVNLNITYITDQRTISASESVALYGTNTSLIETIGDVEPEGCTYCHFNAINAAIWGQPHDPRRLTSPRVHVETNNSQCYTCHIQGTIPLDFHNDSMYYAGDGKILVATNRYVVLDDPVKTPAKVGTGFSLPRNNWSTTYWTGKNTQINATALFVDRYGAPVSGTKINFTIYMPNGTALTTVNDTTNAYGLANFSYDMNAKNYYGNWIIRAYNGSIGANTTFIYNWWGCSGSTTGSCSGHSSKSPGTAGNGNSPYLSGRDSATGRESAHTGGNCTWCHLSFDGKPGGSTGNYLNKPSDVHRNISCDNANCHGTYTTHNSNQLIYSCYNSACHTPANRSDLSNKSTLNSATVSSATSLYSYYNGSSFNSTFHTPNSTVPCIICHGPMHAITKTDTSQRFIRNNATEYGHCIACHQEYVQHNNSVGCSVCHSDDVHAIQVFAQNGTFITLNKRNQNTATGNCTNCHQNSSFFNALLALPKTGNYTGTGSAQIVFPIEHSQDPIAGTKWNQTLGYWNNSNQITWCNYCHNNDSHTGKMLGRVSHFKGNNTVNSTIGNTAWCSSCHWQGYANGTDTYQTMTGYFEMDDLLVPPEISGNATYGANQSISDYINHANFSKDDNSCFTCHNGNLGGNIRMTAFMHNVSIGESGGPNCITCHNLVTGLSGSVPTGINFTSANSSVHYGINSNNATGQGYAAIIGACWACHGSNGTAPTKHPDRYKTPKTCIECHLGSGTYNASSYNATIVDEHYYSGIDIKIQNSTSNISSCINCHENASEMILYNNDTDIGLFTGDGIRLNGGNMSFYHYGRNRTDLRAGASTNCSYCHQNASTAFVASMLNSSNRSISNHSVNYDSSNPGCVSSECHNTGWIHNSTLTKPVLALPNSTYCLSCHGTDGSATRNNLSQHNGTVNCTQCHLNTSGSIHPARYLEAGGSTWNTGRTNAINCTSCHQSALAGFTDAPTIPATLKHSTNTTNGSIWGTFWTSGNGSCYYCHNNTKHNSTALGSINSLLSDTNNTRNGSLTTTTWCADCHYNNSNPNYKGNQWFPVPPLITIDNTGKGYWTNHSGYFNGGYEDTECKSCHALNGSGLYISTSLNYSHSLDSGVSGGPDCVNCHDISGSAPAHINVTAINSSSSIHQNLNSNATATVDSNNKRCWACHGNGTQPSSGHPSSYKTPYECSDCHVPSAGQNLNFTPNNTLLNVTEHYLNGTDLTTFSVTTCYACHNRTEMILQANDPDNGTGAVYSGVNGGNLSVSHYGKKRDDLAVLQNTTGYCMYCHQNISTSFPVTNKSISNHTSTPLTPGCNDANCHIGGRIHNSTLNKTLNCINCHTSIMAQLELGYNNDSAPTGQNMTHKRDTKVSNYGVDPPAGASIMYSKHANPNSSGGYSGASGSARDPNQICLNCHSSIIRANGDWREQNWVSTNNCKVCHNIWSGTSSYNGAQLNLIPNAHNLSMPRCTDCHAILAPVAYSHNVNTLVPPDAYKNTPKIGLDLNSSVHYRMTLNITSGHPTEEKGCLVCHTNATYSINYSADPINITMTNYNGSHEWNSDPYCTVCHPLAGGGQGPTPINHDSFGVTEGNNSRCYDCHSISSRYGHSIESAGGPNCIGCHDYSDTASNHRINSTDMESGIHANLNSNATNSSWVSAENKKCWGCHDANGSQPANNSMGTRYMNPYKCYDCHNSTSKPYSNVSSAMNVSEHFKGGDRIKSATDAFNDSSSCLVCHNLSEMKVNYSEDDAYGSNYSFVSHYGKNRTLDTQLRQGTNTNCSYCHQNASTVFATAMVGSSNSTISNHSVNYNSSNPGCVSSECHNTGWIHNSTLTRPVMMLPNATFCMDCHGLNATSGGTNYTGSITGMKNKHNNSLDCTYCHLNTSEDIHPVKYRRNDNSTWSSSNVSAVNCTTCHQGAGLSGFFSTAKKVPSTVVHSNNAYNGSLWNTTVYWINTSQLSMCIYCHTNSSLHNGTGLGKVNYVMSGNQKNQSLSGSSHWCANCHYNNSDYAGVNFGYNGTAYGPLPPDINISKSETSGDGVTSWYNHTDFSGNYSDAKCKECHGTRVTIYTSVEFVHNVSEGGGGPNCIGCHDVSGAGAPSNKRINATAMKKGVHRDLNSNATNSSALDTVNKACWACHGDGSEPGGHPINYANPYACVNCHNSTSNYSTANTTLLNDITGRKTYEHIQYPYNESINSTVWDSTIDCYLCHNKSMVAFNISFTANNYLAANVSHYANTSNLISPTVNCTLCHQSPVSSTEWYANQTRHPAKSLDYTFCANCHNNSNATTFHDQPLVKPGSIHGGGGNNQGHGGKAVGTGFDWEKDDFNETGLSPENESCVACHGAYTCATCHPPPDLPVLTPKLCENCHLPNTTSLFTGPNQSALYNLRSDINDTLPRVYAHTSYSNVTNVTVPAQSGGDERYTTSCYTLTSSSGEPTGGGTCHAAPYFNRSLFGGYYAQRANDTNVVDWGDPAHWTQTIDKMPNTTNCLFCHNQSNITIRQNWGNPVLVNANNMFGNRYTITNTSCYSCHTRNGTQPPDFHSSEIVEGGGPACLSCHNNSNPQNFSDKYGNPLRYLDGANFSLSVHAGVNTNNASGYGINASCWACHSSSGTVVPNNTHPDRKTNPYTCTDCHLTGGSKTGAYGAPIVYNHYKNGTTIRAGNSSSNISSCITCHENISEMVLSNNDTDYGSFTGDDVRLTGGNMSFYHYGKPRTDLRTWDSGRSINCSYCHQNASTAFSEAMQNTGYNSSILNHSTNNTPACFNSRCHGSGWLHNSSLTKPSLSLPNTTYCQNCHAEKQKHNNTQNCSSCHINSSSIDTIHPIKYIQATGNYSMASTQAANCTNCHQSTLSGFIDAPIIPATLRHSANLTNGSIWGTFWTSGSSSCYYCHNNTKHNSTALGNISSLLSDTNNSRNRSISTTTWCSDCHYNASVNTNYNGNQWSPSPPLITVDNTGKSYWINHSTYLSSGYKDSNCVPCHALNGSGTYISTSLNYSHSLNEGVAGGANCTSCHDIGGSAGAGRLVNFSAMNETGAIHKNLNIGVSSPSGYPITNFKCWACHGNGSEPGSGHPSNYKTPYLCENCHVPAAGQNMNFTPSGILNVTQHYRNGTNISTANASSCYSCHNMSEMMFGVALDPDGPASVYGGINGGNNNSGHYGKKRTDYPTSGTNSYCYTCHNNASTVFPFIDTDNKTISNHSTAYPSTNPPCSDCHGTGRIHNSTLYKPSLTLPNSTYCTACHTTKEQHNGTVNCTQCHLNISKSIHPARYLQADSIWDTARTNAVNCTTCHQSSFSGFTNAPVIPATLKHSSNLSNGTIWGTFWTSSNESCYYCHNNTKHNSTAFGNVISLFSDTNNTRNGSLSTTIWCSDCHYNNSVNVNYKGNQWVPSPPLITVDNTGKSYWINHSTYLDSGYKDNNCLPCHALNGSGTYISTSLNYSHSLEEGRAGGANCTACHDIGGSAGAGRLVNFSAMNESGAIHRNLNIGAATSLPAENKKCWACHGNGSEPGSGHPSNYKTPYLCESCHVPATGQNLNFTPSSILNVTRHYRNGTNISTANASSCYSCHNMSEMMFGVALDPDGPASVYGGINGGNNNSGHYGKKRTDYPTSGTNSYCYTCHNNASTVFPFIDANNKTISNHSQTYPGTNPPCSDCHGIGRIHNNTIYKQSLTLPNSTYCTACHGTGGTATVRNLSQHNGTVNCTQCHLNTSNSIHPVRYLQTNSTWNTERTNAINCTNCHQSLFSGFSNAPLVPTTLKHSSNLTNGSIWGTFWTSGSSSCYYCHNNTKHNSTALGNVTALLSDTNNSRNGSLSTTTWCADCHYNSSLNTNYNGNQWVTSPPLITVDNTGKSYWINHSTYLSSGYKDSNCVPCHALNGSYFSTSLNYSHSLNEGVAGGANCTACHDVGGSAGAGRLVNFSAMNDSSAIHNNLNIGASSPGGYPSSNFKCWACHGNGSEPGTSHPSNYKTPYLCENCHIPVAGQNMNFTPSSILNITRHYKNSTNISTANTTSCYSCHNMSEMMVGATLDPDGPASVYGGINGGNNNSGHYGKKRTDYPAQGTNNYCYTCHNNASTVFPFVDTDNKTIANHSTTYPNTNPPCSDCHGIGRIHNSTLYKPSLTLPNSTYCAVCHTTKQQHNGTINCTQCHLNTSRSIHPARYLQADTTWNTARTNAVNCTTCHQSLFSGFSNAPLVPTTLKHSSNLTNGTIWGMFWTSGSSSCYYCHNNTKHNSTALGNVSSLLSDTNNTRNGSLSTTTWCADCHYNNSANTNYKGSQWSPSPPLITIDNTGKGYWINHSTYLGSGYKDNNCIPCHALNGSYLSTSLNYSHSLNEGVAGGANCTSCHDVGGSAGAGRLVNFSAMNDTGGIHKNLNIGTTSSSGYPITNFKCWACHGNGSEPGSGHPSNYKTPYLCENCHVPDAGQNMNFTPSSILNVTQHYKNSTNISTANVSSCYSCHNISEMMLGNYDPDGPGSVYGGINGGNNNSGHYGRKRTDYLSSGTNSYCYTCHNNASTVFPFIDSNNRTISNHSQTYPSTNPLCSDCHGTGRIHNSTLYKPSLTLPNSTYCTPCHGTGGTATVKNLSSHNNSVNCTKCHLNASSSIHPVRYLQADSTWNTTGTSAVNCTSCHQSTLSGFTNAPLVPATLKHSANLTNGSIWGTFWQGSNSSCYYCHNNTKHNSTALGNISNLLSDTNNSRNGSLSVTTWCSDCHYNASVNTNYKGNQWVPSPPLITVDNTGKSYWINHSTYLGSGYKDSNCVPCHSLNGSYSSTPLNYSHSLNEGRAGGANCTGCHDVGGSAGAGRLVNFSAMNETGVIHKNLNIGVISAGGYPITNFKCWACHGNGSEPGTSHPSNYKTPYLCEDCHIVSASQNLNFTPANILNVSRHYRNSTNISTVNASLCYSCHNLSEMMLGNYDPDGPASVYGGINGGNNNSGHYGKKRTDYPTSGTNSYCYTCHNNASTVFPFSDSNNKTISNHSQTYPGTNPPCSDCHGTGRIHNSTLYKPSFSLPNSTYCTSCHGTGGTATVKNLSQHNGTVNCTQCHLNTSNSIHPVRYFQADSTWNTARTNAVNCTNCHQSTLAGFTDAPLVPSTLKHSANLTNGSIWGTFWTSGNGSCYYCHNNTKHNSTALGNISNLLSDTNNTRNGSLSTTTWCSDCHYNASVNTNYKGSQWIPSPPLITVDNTGKSYWINHSTYLDSGYKDNNCLPCHALNGSGTYISTSLNYSHSLEEGRAGGANCTSCHDIGGSAGAGRLVNFSAMNESSAIHRNLNIGAATSLPAENKKCWACHGNGSEPGSGHPSNYKTPYLCENCHVPDAGQNLNFTPASILNVTQHYKNSTNISTANASSCYSCHNLSEMMVGTALDPDGPASVYGGINGGNNNSGHYGKKRIDYPPSGTNSYCYTCHNNASTVFPFTDENNRTISNHSTTYPSTNPPCSDCHGSGRIHNSTLYRPSFSLPNSTYCVSCHSSKQRHNGTVNCTQCHLNSSNSIHPVRYLESGGLTWGTTKINAANCSNCHQSLLPGFTNTPIIPVLKHSVDTSSGQKWGNYWNDTSAATACYYCHQNETHKANNLLGNISSIKGSNTYNNPTLSNSTWCINCHYANSSQYNGSILSPIPPEITNSSLNASDGTVFYNHSGLSSFNDSICKDCHGGVLSGYLETTLNFSHSVSEGGGGPDCISCHDTGGSGAPDNKRVNTPYVKMGVHKNLNGNATNTTAIDPVNKACWACHGEGTEPSGHPARYRTPRECSNNDCHSLSQSFKAPMVYSHFKDAGRNSNPGNITNLNVSVKASCESCHSNSIAANSIATSSDNLNASVSHYATRDKLIDSINCIYCHLDTDNAEKWGNATEINKNRTAMVEMNRVRNKFTARVGEFVELGLGYRLKIKGISDKRGSAIMELYRGNDLLDTGLVNLGRYTYEENRVIDNSSSKIPVIVLNITGMFLKDNNEGFIQFEGSRIKRLHPENRTTSCYLCHFTGGTEKHKYTVMDLEDDYLYYTEVLINSSDSKEYDQQQALQILATATSSDTHIDIDRANRKTIKKGEKWKLAENYVLNLEDVAQNSDSAIFLLDAGGTKQTNVVRKGETLDYKLKINYLGYTYSNITIFRANVSEIMQPGMVVLEDIVALSPEITSININSSVYGYNASWLMENNTFMTGKIPENIHSPLFTDGRDGGADCTSCHDMGELGFHKTINQEAKSTVSDANKACWACHGEGNEPGMHPINYKQPKDCKSCHVKRKMPFYNATYIGDEKHSTIEDCRPCHVVGTHKIIRFYVTPGIKELSISRNEVYAGEKVILNATAASGYAMSIRGAEYYIDSPSNAFPMSARDGSFDGRVEEMTAEIDTAGLKPGEHLIFIRARERNDRWGPESSITVVVKETSDNGSGKMIPEVPGFILILMMIALAVRGRRLLR